MDRKQNPFHRNPPKAIDGFTQIVEGLVECEKRGIAHRDLSLANVLVTDNERITLIDFGLCQIDVGNVITQSEEAVGTPHYRPPECSGHQQVEPTIKADLYSAGKILWSMITNRPAFDREKPVFNELSLSKLFPEDHPAWHLHHIFEGTIRRDPNRRFNTLLALREIKEVRRLVVENFKPLEFLASDT